MAGPPGVSVAPSQVTSFVQDDPVVSFIIAAIILVVIGVIVVGLVRRFRRPPGTKFARALARPDEITVLMHLNPDPDAMACALAVAYLAEEVGTPATIRHPGQIRHHENRAFRTVLELESSSIETANDLPENEIVLVDHNEPRGFTGSEDVSPYAVVDHHPGDGQGLAFTDVRPDYGACASILAEYLRDLDVELVDEDDPEATDDDALPVSIATGLLYGILSDTDYLTRGACSAEFEASAYLYPGIDEDLLDRIANPPVDVEVLDVKARAIAERDVRSPFVVSDVGEVSNVDAIPQAADELLALEGVSAVVVMGHVDETLHLSGRSRDDRVHMGEVLDSAVGHVPMSGAGGHARMGGGQVSIPHMEGLRPDSGMTREDLKERLFDALGGDIQR